MKYISVLIESRRFKNHLAFWHSPQQKSTRSSPMRELISRADDYCCATKFRYYFYAHYCDGFRNTNGELRMFLAKYFCDKNIILSIIDLAPLAVKSILLQTRQHNVHNRGDRSYND